MRRRIIFLTLILVFLSGCATFTLWTRMEQEEYIDDKRCFSAVVPGGWMRYNLTPYFLLTKNGTVLERVIVERCELDEELAFTKKKFFEGMSLQDLADIEIDNLRSDENRLNFNIIENRPTEVGGIDSIRFNYSYKTSSELKIKGVHYAFRYDKWVYRINYEACAQHYYNTYLADFTRFVRSFQVLAKK